MRRRKAIVDALAIRQLPDVWEVGGKKRVLRSGLTARQETLLLLYSCAEEVVLVEDLCEWVEYSQVSMFRRNILQALHGDRLIELDDVSGTASLSPKGAAEVERTILDTAASG